MISFDTFTGEAHDVIDEQRHGTIRDCDVPLLHAKRRSGRRSSRSRRAHRRSDSDLTPPTAAGNTTDDDELGFSDDASATATTSKGAESGDSRVYQLFQLLSLKNHTRDAKRALVQRLLGVTNVNALVLSKATEEQIASAANDAITDEILASVDLEDRRRQSESEPPTNTTTETTSTELVVATQDVGPYRVLELVDVLDSTTGGMVKRILTNVRRRQRSSGNGNGTPSSLKAEVFCGFCVDYRSHNTAQHKCRRCGACGVHRSQHCGKGTASTPPSARPPTPRSSGRRRAGGTQTPTPIPKAVSSEEEEEDPVATRTLTPDASDKSYCSFCGTWGFHSTENHRCRICGVQGTHRSRHCKAKSSSEGYRWRGSPAEPSTGAGGGDQKVFCDLCQALRTHSTQEHRCRICLKLGEHRSKACPLHSPTPTPPGSASSPARPPSRGRLTPRTFCSFCGKEAAHKSEEHICRICRSTGLHRSGDCPARGSRKPPSSSQSVLSYSVETASKVRARVLESIPLVLPVSATTLVMDSLDKVGDVDTILRRTLQRIGVWGGGSQTPITTPYAAPAAPSSSVVPPRSRQSSVGDLPPLPALQPVDGHGVYVISYAEGRSVVPERILKYMRLLMHHEISTNAFSVVVVFDPRPSTWELAKPGMVTPRSLPSSPTMSEQLKKRMAKYTLQTLLGARDKLVALVVAQKRFQQQQQQSATVGKQKEVS